MYIISQKRILGHRMGKEKDRNDWTINDRDSKKEKKRNHLERICIAGSIVNEREIKRMGRKVRWLGTLEIERVGCTGRFLRRDSDSTGRWHGVSLLTSHKDALETAEPLCERFLVGGA